MADTYALAQIKAGHPIVALTSTLNGIMGYWWVSLLLGAFCGTIYLRTGDSTTPLLILLISSLWMMTSLPAEAFTASAPLAAIGLAGLLYRIYGPKK